MGALFLLPSERLALPGVLLLPSQCSPSALGTVVCWGVVFGPAVWGCLVHGAVFLMGLWCVVGVLSPILNCGYVLFRAMVY